MENQHRKIKGYRELTQEEIDLMNEIKAKGEELRILIQKIEATSIAPPEVIVIKAAPDGIQSEFITGQIHAVAEEADNPDFWLRRADASFRAGLMYATRAVAQPTSY